MSSKITIIGAGSVGATIAYTLSQRSIASEIVLIDADMDRAEGEALDISHGVPFSKHMKIYEDKGLSRKEAMKAVAKDRGVSKREIYAKLLEDE